MEQCHCRLTLRLTNSVEPPLRNRETWWRDFTSSRLGRGNSSEAAEGPRRLGLFISNDSRAVLGGTCPIRSYQASGLGLMFKADLLSIRRLQIPRQTGSHSHVLCCMWPTRFLTLFAS